MFSLTKADLAIKNRTQFGLARRSRSSNFDSRFSRRGSLARRDRRLLDTWFHRQVVGQLEKVFVRNVYGHAKILLDRGQGRLEVRKSCFRIAAGVGRDDYLALSADEFVEA